MILFIIPLAARQTVKNWEAVEANLARTLTSLTMQDSKDFRVLVVGHDRPEIDFPEQFEFKKVAYQPIPFTASHSDKIADANCKVAFGWAVARHMPIDYVMRFDADDLLHREFVAELSKLDDSKGIALAAGYIWTYGARWVQCRKTGFWRHCGSSVVVQREVFDGQWARFREICQTPAGVCKIPVPRMPFEHKELKRIIDQCDRTFEVSRPLVMYVVEHGQNNQPRSKVGSLRFWRRSHLTATLGFSPLNFKYLRLLTEKIRVDFSIT